MRRPLFAVLVAALLTAACGDQIEGPSRTTAVTVRDNSFAPQTINISRGGSVRWTNNGNNVHNVVGDNNVWNSGNLQSGQSFTHQFAQAGVFAYRCSIHPDMLGTVIVD